MYGSGFPNNKRDTDIPNKAEIINPISIYNIGDSFLLLSFIGFPSFPKTRAKSIYIFQK